MLEAAAAAAHASPKAIHNASSENNSTNMEAWQDTLSLSHDETVLRPMCIGHADTLTHFRSQTEVPNPRERIPSQGQTPELGSRCRSQDHGGEETEEPSGRRDISQCSSRARRSETQEMEAFGERQI